MIADSLFRFSLPYSWNSRVEGKVGGLRGLSQLPRGRVGAVPGAEKQAFRVRTK